MPLSTATPQSNYAQWKSVLDSHKQARNQFLKKAKNPGSWKDIVKGNWAMAILKIINKLAGVGDAIQFQSQMIRQMEGGMSQEEAFEIMKKWQSLSANYP